MPQIEKGQWALITGGSSGIGSCFALQLAERGMNLTLVGRDKNALRNVAQKICCKNGVVVETESVDFVKEPERLKDFAERRSYDLLCNNAGMGAYGQYLNIAWERHRDTILLNAWP
ncbi:MAG: SDR family NAD(P)-dependent oxidoreductase [Candidatus Caldatribacteriaceae bacterium]